MANAMDHVFSPDPEQDRMLRGRTLAVCGQIEQIFLDTTNADAFRRYTMRHVSDLKKECEFPNATDRTQDS